MLGLNALANEETDEEVTRKAVTELHRLSGLTWDQLARLFGVSGKRPSGPPLAPTRRMNHALVPELLDAAYGRHVLIL